MGAINLNSIFFFIPFLLVASFGIYQDVFALESYRGYDYQTVKNPDGSYSTTVGMTPYVFDGNNYVEFVNSGLVTTTEYGSISLNSDGSYSVSIGNKTFTDKIIGKYADTSDLSTWTYPSSLNNDTPDNLWDGTGFFSSKYKPAIGQMVYKYMTNDGRWKTELEVTNLSGLNTKAFGFDQIIDIESDTIKFGGVIRNLDNFNGTTFSKNFLDNNKGKTIDFLNGFYFDFDLGYENLYSVTVYDTGANKSRLVFDYRTSEALLPNQKLIIDPVVGPTQSTAEKTAELDVTTGVACSGTGSLIQSGYYQLVRTPSADNATCLAAGIDFSLAGIPTDSTITDVDITYDIDFVLSALSCTYRAMSATAASYPNTPAGALALFTDATDGTAFVSADTGCETTGTDKTLDLGASADADLQSKLGTGTWSLGMGFSSYVRDGTNLSTYGGSASNGMELTVTYTVPSPWAVTDLTSLSHTISTIYLDWTAPYAGSPTQSIIGYQINRTTPYSASPSTIYVNDTGSVATAYNVTGMTVGNNYSFRVSAWTNNTGGHPLNNVTGNVYNVPFWTPAVTTLDGTATAFTTVALDWTVPSSFSTILCYMINSTTPWDDDPLTISEDCLVTTDTVTVSNLLVNANYSFRVSPVTVFGGNDTGNIFNVTTSTQFELGALSDLDRTNTDDFSIFFERDDVNATHMFLNVTYPNVYDLLCDFDYQLARTNQTYGNLTSISVGDGDVESAFLFINQTGDVIHVRCWDVSYNDEAFYVITIQDFPLLGQIDNLRNGTYGTLFKIGLIDGITLIVVILSMIGFNRTNPVAGIVFMVITIGVLSYFEIITYPIIIYPALAMLVVWAFISTRKDD